MHKHVYICIHSHMYIYIYIYIYMRCDKTIEFGFFLMFTFQNSKIKWRQAQLSKLYNKVLMFKCFDVIFSP